MGLITLTVVRYVMKKAGYKEGDEDEEGET